MTIRLSPYSDEQETEDLELSKDMLSIWKDTFLQNTYPPQRIYLTKKRTYALTALLDNLFEGNIIEWKNYCYSIRKTLFTTWKKNSQFSLEWALNFDNASFILQRPLEEQ